MAGACPDCFCVFFQCGTKGHQREGVQSFVKEEKNAKEMFEKNKHG